MSDAHHDEIAKLESLYEEHPEGRIFTHLAEAYRKAGKLDRAHSVVSEGLGRFPDYSSAHVVLGRVLMDQERDGEAEAEFQRVLELDPHNLIAIRALGDLARARGDDQQALEHYRRLLDQESDDAVQEIVDELSGHRAVSAEAETRAAERVDEAGFESVPDTGAFEIGAEAGAFQSAVDAGELEGATDDPPFIGSDDDPDDAPVGPGETDEIGLEALEGGWAGPREEPEAMGPMASGDAEVKTETIAQVYARQGLYDRAADVYRELVRARPGDEGLKERLAEMEQLADARSAGEGEVDAVNDLPVDATTEPLAGVERDELEAEPEPMDGFQPTELDTDDLEVAPLPGLETEETHAESGLAADASPELATGDDLSDELGVTDVPEPPEESPFGDGLTAGAGPDADPEDTVWTGEDFGGESEPDTPHAWAEEGEPDASPPVREYLTGLLGWGGEAGADGAEEPGPGVERGTGAAASGSVDGEAEEDDDLEMFRSWLESLKQ